MTEIHIKEPFSQSSYTFEGQREGEQVIATFKQHSWILFPVFALLIALLIVLGFSFHLFGASLPTSIWIGLTIIVGGGFGLYRYFLWNNSLYILTNQRIVKVDQKSLFNRQIAEAELSRIQEISTQISGPIRTLLNFGTIKIQTASSSGGQMDLENVPNPYLVQQSIVQAQRQAVV